MTTPRERVASPLRTSGATGAADARTEPDPALTPAAHPAPAAPLPLRELTGWEEEYLERHQHEPNTARVCNEVLARSCVPPGEDPGDVVRAQVRGLLVADRDRELVRLRTLSLGADIEGEVACPSCGEVNLTSFSLDDLDLDLPAVAQRERVDLGEGRTASVRLPTAGDQEEMLEAGIESPAERRSWLVSRCVLELAGEPLDLAAARALPLRTRARIERSIEERVPELDLEMALDCVRCGKDFTSPFDIAVFFFRHDRDAGAADPARPPAGVGLPLVGTADLDPAAAPAHRLPPGARGRCRRRPAGRPDRGDRPVRVTGPGPAAAACSRAGLDAGVPGRVPG